MSGAELLFSLPARVGAPALVFGESDELPVVPVAQRDPRALVFRELVADIKDIRALVFSDEPDDAPPAINPVTLQVSTGLLAGLRGHITLRTAVRLQASGQITGLRGHITLRTAVRLQAGGQITGLRGFIGLSYASNTERPLVGQSQARLQSAAPALAGMRSIFQTYQPLQVGTLACAQTAKNHIQGTLVQWQTAAAVHGHVHAHFEYAQNQSRGAQASFQGAIPVHAAARSRFESALALDSGVRKQQFQTAFWDRHASARTNWQNAIFSEFGALHRAGNARPLASAWHAPWQNAWPPRPGRSPRPVPPVLQPCYTPNPALLFSVSWSAGDKALVFMCERIPAPAGITVPIRKAYIVINSITLHRVDTGAELHAHDFSMSLDDQSWTWSWQASLHHDAAVHLGRDSEGGPAELAVTANGIPFRLRLEHRAQDQRFNPTRWAVSGRGTAAILDEPWAPSMSFGNAAECSAQQLMADVLSVNGVSLGWDIDWGLTDWPVPAGAWSFRGGYIDAVNDIAGSVKGYVQPHLTGAVLRVLPRYPVPPWYWSDVTPDFEIPADAVEVLGTAYIDKPAYNKVFVGGTNLGVFGPFRRAGTAGDVLAPQVIHPLITHADAHRQRGLAELSDVGSQRHVTLSMQVLPETGIIMPGSFLRLGGSTTGIVRATSLGWGRPKLRQNIRIETHV